MTHTEREIYAMSRMLKAHDNARPDWAGRWWRYFTRLHFMRTPQVVREMEKAKGLC